MTPPPARRAARRAFAATAAAVLLLSGSPSAAQDSTVHLAVAPSKDSDTTFLIERTETDARGPVDGQPPPRKSNVTSLVRVRGKDSSVADTTTLAITFLRVKGVVGGGALTEPVTFDRNTKDAPDGRPETALVGRTVELDVHANGTITSVRGVTTEVTGSAAVATSTVRDLSTLVTSLPAGAVAEGVSWPADVLEGRGLLRRQVVTRNVCDALTAQHAVIKVSGKLAPAPEGAPEAFAEQFRLLAGERTATYRVAIADGLPIIARHETEFSVEAPLAGSNVDVRVTTSTLVTVRRRDAAGAAADLRRLAPRPSDRTPNTRLPAWIGTSRAALRRLLGEPPVASPDGRVDAYPAMGLIYSLDADDVVRELEASGMGEGFAGRILGVQVGDLLADAEKLWGRPTTRERGDGPHDVATFAFDDLTLVLYVQRDAEAGRRMADEVLRIGVRLSK